MQTVAIQEAKMSDLVAFYNAHVIRIQDGKTVKKFADRPTAEKRCAKLGDSLASYFEATSPESVPPEGFIFVGEMVTDDGEAVEIEAAGVAPVAALNGAGATDEPEDEGPDVNTFGSMAGAIGAMGEKHEPAPTKSNVGRASNSQGVSLSWLVPDVRARRLTRDSVEVTVDGQTFPFKSSQDVFRHFHLQMSKHIRFRLKLKAARTATFTEGGKDYVFTIVEGGAEE